MKKLLASHKAALGVFAGAVLLSAGILAATTMALLNPAPTLSFEGLRLRVIESGDNAGTIQASVDVCVENIAEAAGGYARLEYNQKYLSPSDKDSNEVIVTAGLQANSTFFNISPKLYAGDNPFVVDPTYIVSGYQGFGQCAVDTAPGYILLNLMLEENLMAQDEIKKAQKGESEEYYYYFGTGNKKVVLCTLTFAVEAEDVQTIVKKFGGSTQPADDYLLKVNGDAITDWSLPYYYGDGFSDNYTGENGAQTKFIYQFEPVLIDAKAAERQVEVNAWQAFTNGRLSDLAALLQSRSPMVTIGYADGKMENTLIKWGEEKTAGDYQVYRFEGGVKGEAVTAAAYTPTGGSYLVEQAFYYKERDALGAEVEKKFPLPIQAIIKVNPIKLTGITADNLNKSYNFSSTLEGKTYSTYDSLELPLEAKLLTDVVPGGVSLSLPIAGWTPADTGKMTDLVNEAGKHWPATAADTDGVGTYSFAAPAYAATDAQDRYPWLTVALDWAATVVAKRTIVADGGVVDPSRYVVKAAADDDGKLGIVVERWTASGGSRENMEPGASFRVRLPNGEEVQGEWFKAPENAPAGSDYGGVKTERDSGGYYTVTIDPGKTPSVGDYREMTRRAINLGGWFSISIQEQGTVHATDFIPVLADPRSNRYTADKVYNFTGINAGLFSHVKPLGTTVTVPRGTYVPIDNAGALLPEESYGVTTTYDGATGGEPGRLYTFAVNTWAEATSGGITQYGPSAFANANYSGYGAVENKDARNVTVRTETETTQGDGVLKLTYEGTGGSVTTDVATGNVKLALYDTRQYGYTSRQEYRFTLTNTGDMAITGIYIPKTTHFQVIGDGPAPYLPPHTSTTFVLTYRYGLDKDNTQGKTYKDTVSIRYGSTKAPLDFDAQFRVSAGPVRKVTVKLLPELMPNESMGTAGLIVGEVKDGSGAATMDYTVNAPTYESGSTVYLSAAILDEYAVEEVYYYENNNEAGVKKALTYYDPTDTGAAEITSGTFVYSMGMPTYNVTVYVKFKEPVYSKLRIAGLLNFAAADSTGLKPGTETPEEYEVWQKKFAETELGESVTDLDRLKLGEAHAKGFSPNVSQYLVVIPATAAVDQVEVRLRNLVIQFDENQDILPRVEILLVGQGLNGGDLAICDEPGTTVTPSVHTSSIFPAPDKGNSTYVMIRLSAPDEDNPNLTVFRHYYLEVARDTDGEVGTMGYGNSPYGMIMNATNISTADKAKAKQAFIDNRYQFSDAYRPTKAKDMTKRYWPEAWVDDAENYDLNETAYFALLGQSSSTEPGVSGVADSSGRPVPGAEIARTAVVKLRDGVTEVTLDLGTAASKTLPDFRVKPDGGGSYDLLPGVYQMIYSYTDYNGDTISAFQRPFIILGTMGDVNGDGWVITGHGPSSEGCPSDLDLLQNRIKYPLELCDEVPLFRLRSCDVNSDGNINNIDANKLRYQVPPVPFYLPTGY